jgi:hypothetical protein
LNDNLFKATEKEFGDKMLSKDSVALIKESVPSIEREKKISNALDEISLLYSSSYYRYLVEPRPHPATNGLSSHRNSQKNSKNNV